MIFFLIFLFFQFSLSLSLFRWWLHGGQVPFIKRKGVIFSLGNVYVPSTAPNWENRLPLRKPSVSAPCELSGWFLPFMRRVNPPVISPFHLSACYRNCSEGSVHPFRHVSAWFPNVVLGLHCKKAKPHPKEPFLLCFNMDEHRLTGTAWKNEKRCHLGGFYYYFRANQPFPTPKQQIMRKNSFPYAKLWLSNEKLKSWEDGSIVWKEMFTENTKDFPEKGFSLTQLPCAACVPITSCRPSYFFVYGAVGKCEDFPNCRVVLLTVLFDSWKVHLLQLCFLPFAHPPLLMSEPLSLSLKSKWA